MSAANALSFAIATQNRRSIRTLQAISPIPDSSIVELASNALLHVPSAFNSQTTRLTILFSEAYRKLWSIIGATFEAYLGAERFTSSGFADKISGYKKSYGTILFWDDVEALEKTEERRARRL